MLNSFMISAVTLARAKTGVNDRRKSPTAAVPELLNCTNLSRLEVPDKAMPRAGGELEQIQFLLSLPLCLLADRRLD
jgi:hypothetical protein